MNRLGRFITSTVIILITATAACAGEAVQKPPFLDYWLAVSNGAVQVGCVYTALSSDTLNGQEVFKREEHFYMKMKDSDAAANVDMNQVTYVTKRFTPLLERLTFTATGGSAEKTVDMQAACEMDYVTKTRKTTYKSGGETKEETVKEDIDPSTLDYSPEFCARPLKVGDKLTYCTSKFTSPDMFVTGKFGFVRSPSEVTVLRREKIEVNKETYDALVLQEESDSGKSTTWQLDNGVVVKGEMPGSGLMLTSVTEQQALKWLSSDGLAMDRVPSDKVVSNPSDLFLMYVKLIGVEDKSVIISDSRQKGTYDAATRTADYQIMIEPFDAKKSVTLPVVDQDKKEWLAPAEGIECDDETIRRTAAEIIGGTKNAYNAACKIRRWVYDNVTYDSDAETPMSAMAILKEKTGVCSHHAVLYTALARAVGIPTYLASGLSCAGEDFGWHAWAESYVGEWVAFDPTREDDTVDAGHIKMWTGNVDTIYEFGGMRGRIRAKIGPLGYHTRQDAESTDEKDKHWSPKPGLVYIIYPDENMAIFPTRTDIYFDGRIDTTGGMTVQTTNNRSFLVPAGSKLLTDLDTLPGHNGYTIRLSGEVVIQLPDKTTVILPPGSKLLPPE